MTTTDDPSAPRPRGAAPAPLRPVRQAATLIVLRDGPSGMEILMMLRAQKDNDQNSGASVFPGGVLDAHDRGLHDWCCGLDDAAASARLGVPAHGLDFYAAAVRECFEEAGLLLASDADGRSVTLDHLSVDQLAALRHAAERSTDALVDMCARHGWRLAVDRLAYFSHWLTPPGMPRRFDTRFFVARMPAGQEARADGRETVAANWLRAADALDPARGLKLMNVTRRILESLSAFATVDECLAHVRGLRAIRRTMPRIALGPGGPRPINVDHPAYDEVALLDPDGAGHVPCTLAPGQVTRLFARVWRVAGASAGARDEASGKRAETASGRHGYLVGSEREGWTLIAPEVDADADGQGHAFAGAAEAPLRAGLEALAAATTGPVRRIVSPLPGGSPPASTRRLIEAAFGERAMAATLEPSRPGDVMSITAPEAGAGLLQATGIAASEHGAGWLLPEEAVWFPARAAATAEAPPQARWIALPTGFIVGTSPDDR